MDVIRKVGDSIKVHSKNGDDPLPAEGKHVVINGTSLVY